MNLLKVLSSVDLRKVPDNVLHEMLCAIEAEAIRRRGEKKLEKSVYKSVFKRIKGGKNCPRTQEDLFHPEWNTIYPCREGKTEDRRFYVYAHVVPSVGFMEIKTNPDDWVGLRIPGTPFYIGKGTGGRAYDLCRNQGHGEELRSLLKRGTKPSDIVSILADNLTEQEALKIEAKLIYLLGTRYERDVPGLLVNLDRPPRPAQFDSPRVAT